jgi:hypothetical protein
MSMKVHSPQTDGATAAAARTAEHAARRQAAKTPQPGSSFASFLASQATGTKSSGTAIPKTDAVTPAEDTATSKVSLRKGESMQAVTGHAYAEISGGRRDGLYVNTSGNKRHGDSFVLVFKNGREYHIYGTGDDRVVVALRKPDADVPQTPNTAAGTGGITPTVSAS